MPGNDLLRLEKVGQEMINDPTGTPAKYLEAIDQKLRRLAAQYSVTAEAKENGCPCKPEVVKAKLVDWNRYRVSAIHILFHPHPRLDRN